jgi:hypothetical protein
MGVGRAPCVPNKFACSFLIVSASLWPLLRGAAAFLFSITLSNGDLPVVRSIHAKQPRRRNYENESINQT